MKREDYVILFKGFSVFVIGFFSPWASALSQWNNADTSPPTSVWYAVILPASVIGAFSALSAFLSTSWHTYKTNGKNETT